MFRMQFGELVDDLGHLVELFGADIGAICEPELVYHISESRPQQLKRYPHT
jgi:hypothetical protein